MTKTKGPSHVSMQGALDGAKAQSRTGDTHIFSVVLY